MAGSSVYKKAIVDGNYDKAAAIAVKQVSTAQCNMTRSASVYVVAGMQPKGLTRCQPFEDMFPVWTEHAVSCTCSLMYCQGTAQSAAQGPLAITTPQLCTNTWTHTASHAP